MSARYNPHSFQKQARKWPVSVSIKDFISDLEIRTRQIWNETALEKLDSFSCELPIEREFAEEYGVDCCRLAHLEAQNLPTSQTFLDSAFKWLAKLFSQLHAPPSKTFSAKIWFEMALQAKDHILDRKMPHAGLACIKRAVKLSPPNSELADKELSLVRKCIYPFAPILAQSMENEQRDFLPENLKDLFSCFPELVMIRYSIEKGGWHWGVFQKKQFSSSPIETLLSVKWVNFAAQGKKLSLKNTSEGQLICFS